MLKKVFTIIVISLLSTAALFATDVSPEQFLENYATYTQYEREGVGNFLIGVGASSFLSSLLLEDELNKSTSITIGLLYSGLGLYSKQSPSSAEKKYQSYLNKEISALDAIEELRLENKQTRYVYASLFALVGVITTSGSYSSELNEHPEDTRVMNGSISLATSLYFLLHKTTAERLCEDMLNRESPKKSYKLRPMIHSSGLAFNHPF